MGILRCNSTKDMPRFSPSFFLIMLLLAGCGGQKADPAQLFAEDYAEITCVNEYVRGEEKRMDVKASVEDKSEPGRQKRAKVTYKICERIDRETAKHIQFLDQLKLAILRESGENLRPSQLPGNIILRKADTKEPLRPIRFQLKNVKNGGSTDQLAISSANGQKIIRAFRDYRKFITELTATAGWSGDNSYFFHAPYPAFQ